MLKVDIFVHCDGWKTGGYSNTLYFKNENQLKEFKIENDDVDIISIHKVSYNDYLSDYISEY